MINVCSSHKEFWVFFTTLEKKILCSTKCFARKQCLYTNCMCWVVEKVGWNEMRCWVILFRTKKKLLPIWDDPSLVLSQRERMEERRERERMRERMWGWKYQICQFTQWRTLAKSLQECCDVLFGVGSCKCQNHGLVWVAEESHYLVCTSPNKGCVTLLKDFGLGFRV